MDTFEGDRLTRRALVLLLAAFTAVAMVASSAPAGARASRRPPRCPAPADSTIFAGGGTPLSNGTFFPGTATYYDNQWVGEPLIVPRGCNIKFVNLDVATLTNGHQIVSLKRKHGSPMFASRYVAGPDTATVRTKHLKTGTYPYFCSIHYGMWGLIEIRDL